MKKDNTEDCFRSFLGIVFLYALRLAAAESPPARAPYCFAFRSFSVSRISFTMCCGISSGTSAGFASR